MNDLLCEYPALFSMIIVFTTFIIIALIVFKPYYRFICYSKTDDGDEIRYNIFNKTYYYCHNDHYGCIWKDKMTNLQLKEYDLIATKPLENKKVEKKIKNKTKMERSKPSFLVRILKTIFLIFIIIISYKIGLILIEKLPELINNQFK